MRQANPPGYVRRGKILQKIWTAEEDDFIRANVSMPIRQICASPELTGRTESAVSKRRVELGLTNGRRRKGQPVQPRVRKNRRRYDKKADDYIPPTPRFASIFHMAQGVQV
jgi:hypothetical protein